MSASLSRLPLIDEVEPLGPTDDQLMKDLHEVLERHGALNRFGVTLLHRHFEVHDDEILLETTDSVNRKQRIEPVKREAINGKPTIDTSWSLETGQPVMRCTCLDTDNGHHHGETN